MEVKLMALVMLLVLDMADFQDAPGDQNVRSRDRSSRRSRKKSGLTSSRRRMRPVHLKKNGQERVATPTSEVMKLLHFYDSGIRPSWGEEPVQVKLSVHIQSLRKHAEAQLLNGEMYVQQTWVDQRLQLQNFKSVDLSGKHADDIWIPDTYIDNMVGGGIMEQPASQRKIQILKNGTVTVSYRLLGSFRCNEFLYAEYDHLGMMLTKTSCPVNFLSFRYDKTDLVYEISDQNSISVDWDGISVKAMDKEGRIYHLDLNNCTTEIVNSQTGLGEEHSVAQIQLQFG